MASVALMAVGSTGVTLMVTEAVRVVVRTLAVTVSVAVVPLALPVYFTMVFSPLVAISSSALAPSPERAQV